MRIALMNGSPKSGDGSASGSLLADLKPRLSGEVDAIEIGLHGPAVSQEQLEALGNTDAWVFSCPLYVDGLPAHLLSCLVQLEQAGWQHRGIRIYGIVNCGFYEGIQAESALALLRNWCAKAGFVWCGGIGVGGGGGLGQMPEARNGHGPKGPIDKALVELADKILRCETQENEYVSVAFPRFLYKAAAQMGWRWTIKANGGKAKDLGKQPD